MNQTSTSSCHPKRTLFSFLPGSVGLTLILMVVVISAMGLTGCASTEPMDVAPPAPVKMAFVPPTWESTEYRSEDGAFFVHYPSDFEMQPLQGDLSRLSVASPSLVPRVDVTVITEIADPAIDAVGASIAAGMAQLGGGTAEIASSEMVTLRDGVTEAMKFALDWTFQGFPLSSVVLVAPAADYHVNVMVTGMDGGDMAQLEDIAFTLTVP